MTKISKTAFIKSLAVKTQMPEARVSVFLSAFVEQILENAKGGLTTEITGFGSFKPVERSARMGINPKTGEKIQIPASKNLAFKTGKTAKEFINN